ncbi:MAG: hypothetical protein CH6_3699 [Candidatus Kapaibacterium sp.]|nr:MAG: hypothetical protein CH6_3699 [Candidatus Kapabacteria bacterium]
MKRIFTFFAISIFVLSCSSYKPPKQYNFVNQFDYNLPYEAVWSKVIQFFAELGLPIRNMDKSSGFIATDVMSASGGIGTLMDCGEPGYALNYNAEFEKPTGYFNVLVIPLNQNQTRVKVTAFYKAYYVVYKNENFMRYKQSEEVFNCNSTGFLEQALLNYIAK